MSGVPSTSYASTSNLDLEAQQLSAVSPAVTHSTWTTSPLQVVDPTDERFGYTLSLSSTHESRHDRRMSAADVLPPYAEEAEIPLPEYTLHAPEPVTLAMYLFRFGFCKFIPLTSCLAQAYLRSSSISAFLAVWSLHPLLSFTRATSTI